MTTRRTFIRRAAATAALAQLPARLFSQAAAAPSEIALSADFSKPLATMPNDFTGLSYESAQLGHPDFFSSANHQLIALFRTLNPRGVLRIGGNTAEYTTWSDNDADAAKNQTPHAIGPDAGTAAKTASILTPVAIRNLKDFITQAGEWRVIYGLNLWHGTPENAAAEAAYVFETLGPRLICFQIGNEPDMDHEAGSKERWTFDHYWERWPTFRDAVKKAVPGARFAGPDIAKELDWITEMADKRPEIDFLSGHYYAEGPPADPKMTLEFLLKRGKDPAAYGEFATVEAATKQLGRPYRMTEGNSCFHGGKPLVSNTFASALWSGDYMLQVAQAGYIGVNLHGGGNGLYTPIAGDTPQGFVARPVFYGMLLAQRFAGSTFVEASLSGQSDAQNVTAFAARNGTHGLRLALFNKAVDPVRINITGLPAAGKARAWWLKAHAIDSLDGVTFGGSRIGADGAFQPRAEQVSFRNGRGSLDLPGYSAAYIEA
ncbi:MAG TPA: glycosyl hydrolase family 79 C-terminal domain-containing protein [Terracidiphilus sp.]|nr:glycosyl hydrolase family 79 C-terminal domain-containing protein [Terracidiphilus sp.]